MGLAVWLLNFYKSLMVYARVVVPDPTNLFGYNRYMMVRENPLKYNDPTGHCVANSDGSRAESDVECWRFVDAIGASWDQNSTWWENTFAGYDKDTWMNTFAPNSNFNQAWMSNVLNIYLGSSSYQSTVYEPRFEPHPGPKYAPVIKKAIAGPCDFWDCPQLGMDVTSLLLSIGGDAALACAASIVGAPACGPVGIALKGADASLAIGSFVYDGSKYVVGESTLWDVSTSGVDTGKEIYALASDSTRAVSKAATVTPGVDVAYDTIMLIYDLTVDPVVGLFTSPPTAR